VFNADLQEHASLHHVHVDIGTTPMTSHNVQAVLQHHASMHSLCAEATKVSNYHVNVCLEGEASSIGLQGISIVPPHHRSTFTLNVEHKAPNTVSSHLYKGLVAHDGIGASQGQVAILRTAPKSISKQHSHFLTLGGHATTHNTPTFAIDIDDVSAVHGATSGTIDPETLFYAASRGLSESQARLHIAEGFCKEIVRQLPAEYIKPLSQAIGNAIGEII
jgi:Fe-S cluster assembly scaffold protein SufB